MAGNNHSDWPHLQGGIKFDTQILPLLNLNFESKYHLVFYENQFWGSNGVYSIMKSHKLILIITHDNSGVV